MKLNLRVKIAGSFIMVILLFTISIVVALGTNLTPLFTNFMSNTLSNYHYIGWELFDEVYEGEWRTAEGKMYKGDSLIEGENRVLQRIQSLAGVETTITIGDTVVASTIHRMGERVENPGIRNTMALLEELGSKEWVNGFASIEGKEYIVEVHGIKDPNGNLIGTFSVATSIQMVATTVTSFLKEFLLIVAIIWMVAIAISYLLTLYIMKNIKKGVAFANALAEGDLTYRADIKAKDEIATMFTALNKAGASLHGLITTIWNKADHLTQTSAQMTESSNQVSTGMQEIAHAVTEIATAAQNNASVAEETTAGIQEVASNAETVSEEAQAAAKDSRKVLKEANEGAQKLEEAVRTIQTIKDSTAEVAGVIGDLKSSSLQIGEIVSMITSIADQTNLLSLNAAIEAARAGEHGRGFAIVAEEVRKLAEQSKHSADQITGLIQDIQSKSENAVVTMDRELQLVDEGVQKTRDTNRAFHNILSSIENMSAKIQNIAQSAEQQSTISIDMAKAIDEFSRSTQNTAASVQEINASVEEQYSIFEELGSMIHELNTMAEVLRKQAAQFKIQ